MAPTVRVLVTRGGSLNGRQYYETSLRISEDLHQHHTISKAYHEFRELKCILEHSGVSGPRGIPTRNPFPPRIILVLSEDALRIRCSALNRWLREVCQLFHLFNQFAQRALLQFLELDFLPQRSDPLCRYRNRYRHPRCEKLKVILIDRLKTGSVYVGIHHHGLHRDDATTRSTFPCEKSRGGRSDEVRLLHQLQSLKTKRTSVSTTDSRTLSAGSVSGRSMSAGSASSFSALSSIFRHLRDSIDSAERLNIGQEEGEEGEGEGEGDRKSFLVSSSGSSGRTQSTAS